PAFAPAFPLCDAATWKPRLAPAGHQQDVTDVTFTPDGQTVLTGSNDRIQAWDAATGEPRRVLEGSWRGPRLVALDGRTLLAAPAYGAEPGLYDIVSGNRTGSLKTPPGRSTYVRALQPSADGKAVVGITEVEGARKVHVWELSTGKEIESRPLEGSTPSDTLLAGGAWLAAVPRAAGSDTGAPPEPDWLVVVDWKRSRQLVRVLLAGGWGSELACGRDGRVLATIATTLIPTGVDTTRLGPSTLQLWEIASGSVR